MRWLRDGVVVAVRRYEGGEQWRYIYAPMSIPGSPIAALEVGESLKHEVAYVANNRATMAASARSSPSRSRKSPARGLSCSSSTSSRTR